MIILTTLVFALTSCGQYGPLYLPQNAPNAALHAASGKTAVAPATQGKQL